MLIKNNNILKIRIIFSRKSPARLTMIYNDQSKICRFCNLSRQLKKMKVVSGKSVPNESGKSVPNDLLFKRRKCRMLDNSLINKKELNLLIKKQKVQFFVLLLSAY